MFYTFVDTPVGELIMYSDGTNLTRLSPVEHRVPTALEQRNDSVEPFPLVKRQLGEYFEGKRTTFDVPISLGGTEFQARVWEELQKIPHGTTISYGELSRRIGNEKASRAVGLANGRNPVCIIVPCHRVIGADGSLTGYAGGLPMKRTLLEVECGAVQTKLREPLVAV